jgi:molecular chaperone DnaK (HSP70)
MVMEVLSLAGIKAENVHYIIHTGGSSLMPLVRKTVKNLFPHLHEKNDILDKQNLKVCSAKGAVLYGMMRSGIQKEQHVRLVSVGKRLPHSYGTQVMKGFKPMFKPIIEMGKEYPTKGIIHYDENEIPKSGILNLKFLQNSGSNNNIKGNPGIRVIGSITIDTLADRIPGCDVEITIDANRKMTISVDGMPVEINPIRFEGGERWIG